MTDESHTHQPEIPSEGESAMPEPAAEEASASSMSMGDFSTGQGMVALGGLIILAVWIVFEVIFEEYGVPHIAILLAAAAAILPRLNRDTVEGVHPLPTLMKVLGYGLAFVGVVEIVGDLRGGILDADSASIIGGLLAYAGYVVAFLGARGIET